MKVICVAAVISGEAKNILHKVFRLVSSEAQIQTAFTYIFVYDYSYIIIHIYLIYEKYAVFNMLPYIRYGVCGKYTDILKKLQIRFDA